MNWAWATSIDQLWRSPNFPLWLTLAAAGFFGLIALITLLRATKSVANGALTVITLLAIGIAVAATLRGYAPASGPVSRSAEQPPQIGVAMMPALSCIDDLAGEAVLSACEKALFGSAESVAAAVSYASARLSQLTALGDVAAASKAMTPDQERLRRAIERDRYGLVAYVLTARDHCRPIECPAYQSLTDHSQIAANMEEHAYEAAIQRHSPSWGAPSAIVPVPALAGIAPVAPTGKPTNADFPTANSIPPVNIMTPEPPAAAAVVPKPAATAAPASPKPPAASATVATAAKPPAAPPKPLPSAANAQAAQTAGQAQAAAKKPPAPKQRAAPPVQVAPAAPSADND